MSVIERAEQRLKEEIHQNDLGANNDYAIDYWRAYHPCWWDDVKTQVTKVGMDSFRGKSAWAKKKFQRVTHWMDKPEPPKEDA